MLFGSLSSKGGAKMNRNQECVIIKRYYGHNQIEKKGMNLIQGRK